ncbi:MAG: lytic murein transglycosylase, partial [Candidatus Marinimicrobia bacterium]|nr:lytic murein transglycosylase [Candidatus Neomarinimicrobiota bacterium]
MKHLTFIYLISFYVYATDSTSTVIDDPVYEEIKLKAMEKGIPASFLKNTFSNESIVIHSAIPERFARPYEKKTWEEYKKLFVTSTRINNGAVFYNKKRKVLEKVANHYGVDSFLILSIIGVESNYGSHHKEFTVFNSLYTQ